MSTKRGRLTMILVIYGNTGLGTNIRNKEVLAESIGVTSQYLSDLERGLVGTSISILMKICRESHVTTDYVLFGSGGKEIEV